MSEHIIVVIEATSVLVHLTALFCLYFEILFIFHHYLYSCLQYSSLCSFQYSFFSHSRYLLLLWGFTPTHMAVIQLCDSTCICLICLLCLTMTDSPTHVIQCPVSSLYWLCNTLFSGFSNQLYPSNLQIDSCLVSSLLCISKASYLTLLLVWHNDFACLYLNIP